MAPAANQAGIATSEISQAARGLPAALSPPHASTKLPFVAVANSSLAAIIVGPTVHELDVRSYM
jgi:hypothetical protein